MSFLFPLYLLGAAAIAIPILLHLRRRPPKEHQTFSSLMFLEKSPERLTRRTRIERWLLLALRCLALILLALMFGRPFLKSTTLPLGEGEGSRVVVLVDSSASMRRSDLWEKALAETRKALGTTGPKDEVALVRFDDRFEVTRTFSSFESLSGSARADAVEDWKTDNAEASSAPLPSWRATDLGTALTSAADLLADADVEREVEEQRIIVISDFQEGGERESLNRYAWPESIKVQPVLIEAEGVTGNLALNLVAASNEAEDPDDAEAETGIRPPRRRVRITNGRDSETEKFSLTWQGNPETKVDGFLPAGASRVMPVPPRPEESSDAVLEVSGDDQDFDNRVFVARAQPRPVNLLYLGNEASDQDVGSPLFYLSRAMHRTPAIDPSIEGATFEAFADQASLIDAADALVLRLGENTPLPVAEKAGNFAQEGNLVIGIVSEGAAAATLEAMTGLTGLTLTEAEVDDYAMLAEVDFEHPVLAPFAQAQIRDFTKIHTWRHRELTLPEASVENVRVLAKFDSGSPAWLEMPVGENGGRVVLFLSGWEPRESQLALSSKFIPLVYGVLGQAGFSAVAEPTRYVGDPIPLPRNEAEIRVTRPDGNAVTPKAGAVEFTATEVPGFYVVQSRDALDREQSRVHAINLAPGESRVEPVDPMVALGEFGIPVEETLTSVDSLSEASAVAGQTESQRRRIEAEEKEQNQKLWKWLLLIVLAVLVLETWLAGRRSARSAEAAAA